MKLEFSRKIFEKISHIPNVIYILPVGAQLVCANRQMNRQDEASCGF